MPRTGNHNEGKPGQEAVLPSHNLISGNAGSADAGSANAGTWILFEGSCPGQPIKRRYKGERAGMGMVRTLFFS